ncbi:MAG: carboxypeptidase-like regulatory domain-containing protein [Candidatus Omnitrophica bacterium]|nr:carboxypeptidase-like regulatory domain-containing protein [Candidatus Omnitrophota bacterium]
MYRAYQPVLNIEELDLVSVGLYDFCDEYDPAVRFTDNLTNNIANLRAVAIVMTDFTDAYLTDTDGDGINLGLDNFGTVFIEDVGFWNRTVATLNTRVIDDFEDADSTKNSLGYDTVVLGATAAGEEILGASKALRIDWVTSSQNTRYMSDVSNGGTQLMDLSGYTHLAFDAICAAADEADCYEVILVVSNWAGVPEEFSFTKALGSKRIQEEYIPLNRFHHGSSHYPATDRVLIPPQYLQRVREIKFFFSADASQGQPESLVALGNDAEGTVWLDNLRVVTLAAGPLYNYPPRINKIDDQDVSYDFGWSPQAHRKYYGKTAIAGLPVTFDVACSDADANLSDLTMTLPGDPPIPTGNTIVWTPNVTGGTATGTLSWTPQLTDVGTHRLLFTAIDDKEARDIQQFDIIVNEPPPPDNNPPVFYPWEGWTINEGYLYKWTILVMDPDDDIVTVTASNMPEGMKFDGYGSFEWQPGYEQAGDYSILLTATDEHGAASYLDMTITVRDIENYIKGKVYDSVTATPLSGVTVTIKPMAYGYGTHDYTDTTDENGGYRVDDLIAYVQSSGGTVTWISYTVHVSVDGYEDFISEEALYSETECQFVRDAALIPGDQDPPVLSVTAPAKYTSAAEGSIIPVEGTVSDASAVQVFVCVGAGEFTEVLVTEGAFSTTVELIGMPISGEYMTVEVKAEDAAHNTAIVLRYVLNGHLHLIELPRYYASGDNVLGPAGIATAQDIIDLMRPDPDNEFPTDTDIYNYAHAMNLPANQGIAELDLHGMDAALEHYDIYAQGYNFDIEAFANMNDYLKEIVHWMSWPVSKQWGVYAPAGVDPLDPAYADYFTCAPYIPVVAPSSADIEGYNRWVVINGFASDISPYEYNTQPWKYAYNTTNITIYGMFITDPSVVGDIGKDAYVAASELSDCLKPLASADTYNGKYVMVAEPPDEELDLEAQAAPAVVNESTEKLIEIVEYVNNTEEGTLERHLVDSTLVVNLKKDNSAVSFSTTADLTSLFTGGVDSNASSISWDQIIPAPLLLNADFKEAVQGSVAREFIKVLRKDTGESYYIIPFDKLTNGQFASYAAIAVDATDGHFLQGSCAKEPTRYIQLTKEEAIAEAIGQNPELDGQEINAQLIWERGGLTSSPFYPYWEVTAGGRTYLVSDK